MQSTTENMESFALMTPEIVQSNAGLMSRRRSAVPSVTLMISDFFTMLICFLAGGLLNFSYQNIDVDRSLILFLLMTFCLVAFHKYGHYSRQRQLWQEFGDIAGIAALALLFDLALLFLLKVNFSRVWVVTSWMLVIPAVPFTRHLIKRAALRLGAWLQPTVVIGTGPSAREIAAAYDVQDNHFGYHVVAFAQVGPAPTERALTVAGREIPVVALDAQAKRLPSWLGSPHVVVALDLDEMLGREILIESLSFHYGDIDVISPLKGLPINRTRANHFFSRELLSLRIHNNLSRPWPQMIKRGFDLLSASMLLLITAPVFAIVYLWITWSDGGKVF